MICYIKNHKKSDDTEIIVSHVDTKPRKYDCIYVGRVKEFIRPVFRSCPLLRIAPWERFMIEDPFESIRSKNNINRLLKQIEKSYNQLFSKKSTPTKRDSSKRDTTNKNKQKNTFNETKKHYQAFMKRSNKY